jgi:hypothetical protein
VSDCQFPLETGCRVAGEDEITTKGEEAERAPLEGSVHFKPRAESEHRSPVSELV